MSTKRKHIENILKINVPKTRLCVSNDNLIALSSQENHFFDISDKKAPKLITNFTLTRNDYANHLLGVVNNKAYFSIGYSGVEVIDLQRKGNSRSLGLLKDILIGARSAFYDNRYLITNPQIPIIYQMKSPTDFSIVYKFSDSRMIDLLVLKNYLCAAFLNDGIKIYDITDPSNPHHVYSLSINAVKLVAKNSTTILAEGVDNAIYVLDTSNLPNIAIKAKIKIPGPIAADSLICKDDFFIVRFMRKVVGDTTFAFDIRDENKPKKTFSFDSKSMPLYTANEKLLVFMGINDWDGVNTISSDASSYYKVFNIQGCDVTHVDDIEFEGVWFSSIELTDSIIYIARPDGIYVYEVKD